MARTNKWQPEKERPKQFKPEGKKKSPTKRMKYMNFDDDDEDEQVI